MSSLTFPNLLRFTASGRLLLVISFLTALMFWISAMISPYPGRWLIKWLAIASLAVIVWQQRSSAQELWLAAGLLCHSIGDILLDLDRSQLFLPAVGAFLCGHVLYLVAFWPEAMAAPRLSSIPKALILTVVGFGLIVGRILIPHLPEMLLVPIVIYMLAICAMAITAIAANYSTIWVVAGAFLYLLSDALIGINTFVRPLSYSEYLIWPAYYFGQLLIALGFLRRNANEWTVA